jgi:hypothetical protein
MNEWTFGRKLFLAAAIIVALLTVAFWVFVE